MENKYTYSFTIYSWMVTELGLSGTDLVVYAIIFGQEKSTFCGGYAMLAKLAGVSERRITDCIARLRRKCVIIVNEISYGRNSIESVNNIRNGKTPDETSPVNSSPVNSSPDETSPVPTIYKPSNNINLLINNNNININNNNNININNNISSSSSARTREDYDREKDMALDWLKDDPEALKLQCIRNNINSLEIEKLMVIFIEDELISGTFFDRKGRQDTKRHFNRWLPMYLRKIREEKPINEKNNGKLSASDRMFADAFGIS